MESNNKNRKMASFMMKQSTIDTLNEIVKEVNDMMTIKITKSQVVDILIQDAKRRDLTKLMLTY